MAKLLRQNVGGVDYTMAGCALTGVCASSASDFIKAVALSDGDQLSDGMTVVVTFANGNTAGTAPLSKTIYSSDQVSYYEDDQLTVPFTLAPNGCYDIEYTGTGNAYSYISYPIMQVGSVSGPLCDASGNKASGALWLAGDKVSINYSNGCFNVIPQATDSMTVMTASSVVNGAPLRAGSTVRIMFTVDLTGADTITALVLNYNGVNTPVKVGKNGALSNFVASEVSSGVYKYVQAYTTLELMFDGTQFIIIGNPVVLSSADYTIYADGKTQRRTVYAVQNDSIYPVSSGAVASLNFIKDLGNASPYTSFLQIPKGCYCMSTAYYSNFTDKPSGANGRAILIVGSASSNSDEQIAILCCATSGQMWIGSCYGGIARYDWKKII